MSGSSSRTIAIRLTTEQADRVKRELQAIGDEGSKALGRIETASASASPALQTLASVSDGAVQAFGRMGVSLGGLERVLTSSRGGLSGVTLGLSALAAVGATAGVSIARAGDALTSTLARLTAATGSMQTAQTVYRELFALSQQTGVSVAESADAFGRFAMAAHNIGATNTQVLALVRTLQQAGIVSGASTAETQAAVAQLGQALASGVLQGDELRSLLENMPQLASRLAEQLGVSVGQLRQMGAAGLPSDQQSADAAVNEANRRLAGMRQRQQAAQGEIDAYLAQGLSRQQATDLALPSLPGGTDKPLSAQITAAEKQLTDALTRQQDLLRQAREEQQAEAEDAAARRLASAKAASAKEIADWQAKNDKKLAIEQAYQKDLALIHKAEGNGAIDDAQAQALIAQATKKHADALAELNKASTEAEDRRRRVIQSLEDELRAARAATTGTQACTAASREMATALEVERKLREAGIPTVEKRTAADKQAAAAIEQNVRALARLKSANDEATKAQAEQKRQQEKLDAQATRTTDDIVRYAGDRFADLFTSTGRGWAGLMQSLEQTAIGTFARIAAEALLRPIVMPIVAQLVGGGGTASAASSLAGALGGAGGGIGVGGTGVAGGSGASGLFGNLGQLLGLNNLGQQLGLGSLTDTLGLGSGLSGLLGTPAIGLTPIAAPAGSLGALEGGIAGFTPGATVGQLLGGFGVGFGAGSLLNNLLGGNQLGATVGSGLGSAAGAVIGSIIPGVGTVLGGLIGGLAGGGLGGLFGPKPSDHTAVGTYDLATGAVWQSNGPKETSDTQAGRAQALAAMQQATQVLQALAGSVPHASIGLEVGTRDGTKLRFTQDGVDTKSKTGVGDIAGIVTIFKNELVGAFTEATGDVKKVLDAAVGNYDQAVAGLSFLQGDYKTLTMVADTTDLFTAQMKALTDTYSAAITKAEQYGLAEQALTDARDQQIAKLTAARDEQAQSITDTLHARLLADQGDPLGASLISFDLQAKQQEQQLKDQIEALGLSGTQYAADRIVEIEQALAAERLKIEQDYASQSKRTAQGLLTQLAFGSGSALAPEQQYFAAISVLNNARQDLAAGGALADFTAVAQQVLPVARDYLGTSQGYAALVADVASLVSSQGGDPAGLGALLAAQVDSTDSLAATFASYGDKQVSAINGVLAEVRRLASTLEALIARQTAA